MNQCHTLQEENKSLVQTMVEDSLPPEIPLRSQLESMSIQTITNISRERNLESITYLNLFNNKIKILENLASLPNLQTLNVSFNQLEEISGLHKNTALKRLDLSHNFIKQIENLEAQKQLTFLDLRYNWVRDIEQVRNLAGCCPSLREFGLKCNPCAAKKTYRITVFEKLPSLKELDNLALSELDKAQSESATVALSVDIIMNQVRQQKKNIVIDNKDDESNKHLNWERQVEELQLSHLQLSAISNLEKFVNLRKLNLLDNNINFIQGLENLRVLEELSLEKNRL